MTIPIKDWPLRGAHITEYLKDREEGLYVSDGKWYEGHETKVDQIFSPKKEASPQTQKKSSVCKFQRAIAIIDWFRFLPEHNEVVINSYLHSD